jgi:hypothetical protein
MDHGEVARARELSNLRLALAMFALQLDVFELRTKETLHAAVKGLLNEGLGKDNWASTKSPGSKSDT